MSILLTCNFTSLRNISVDGMKSLEAVFVQLGVCVLVFVQGKYMDIEFDYKGDPVGGVITNCELMYSHGV